ncbi:MAG: hypothetical protein RMK89_05480 [Armatimonadota bacterium]|nr:hypothetical protein [Armatimonadota bacterium]MDW8142898.1 hypothetical protein [Armatimonadota bacterium]
MIEKFGGSGYCPTEKFLHAGRRALRMNENSAKKISPSKDGAQKFVRGYGLKPIAWLGKSTNQP